MPDSIYLMDGLVLLMIPEPIYLPRTIFLSEDSGMPDEWKVTVTVTLKVGGASTRKEAEAAALERLLGLIKGGGEIPWETDVVPLRAPREPRSDEPLFGVKWE